MKKNKGFSVVSLLAVLAAILLLTSIAFPVFNSYKQGLEVNKSLSYVLSKQKEVESCVYERQNIADCDLGEYGLEEPSNLSKYNIISYNIVDGTIKVTLDNENLRNNTFPIEVAFYAEPKMRETIPTVSWTVYCSDYDIDNNQLYKQCKNDIDDLPTTLPVDWIDWKTFLTPWITTSGIQYNSNWSPVANLQVVDYNQSRGYSYTQERDLVKEMKNLNTGQIIESLRNTEERIVSEIENRSVNVNSTNWDNSSGIFGCNLWSPLTSTVDENLTFTQERVCKQDQERDWIHKVNGNTIHERLESRTVNRQESQVVYGTNPVWIDTTPTYSTWANVGGRSYTSSWSPVVGTQTSNFNQGRNYDQNQERTRFNREIRPKTNDVRIVSEVTESKVVTGSESRVVSVNPGAWANNSAIYGCGAWSPSTSTVDEDKNITQSRTCKQDEARVWSYTSGSTNVGTRNEGRTVNRNQTQVVSGTKPVWIDTTPTYSTWANVGGRSYAGSWSPAVGSQTSTFNQTINYNQNQKRTRNNREFRPATGQYRTVYNTTETRTVSDIEVRSVNVTNGGWVNSGGLNS